METHIQSVVLVVEDEPLILLDALEIVTAAGFHALAAANADEAIAILESRNDIRVIFTDINMPGSIDGLKLAHAVRRRWPPIEIIVASAALFGGEHKLPERGVFIRKPYSEQQLARTLRELVR